MNNSVLDLLNTLGSTPNWKYQLGLAQIAPQEQATAAQYQLGQQSLADQMSQFQAQNALQQAQQNWAQQFANTGQQQQYGLQSGAQQFGQQQQQTQNNLQNWLTQIFGPSQANAQLAQLMGSGGAGGAASPQVNPPVVVQPGQPFSPQLAARNPGYARMFSQPATY